MANAPQAPEMPASGVAWAPGRSGRWATCALTIAWLLLATGCREVVERFDSPNYPSGQDDYVSDLDYCDQVARATLHSQGEIDTDIGRELQTDHTTQGPDTLERNMRSYEEREEFQRIVDDCLRHRRESRPLGSTR
ncbi:MAG TPA: hypothetical protein VLV76_27810 [Candidatus Acidoferrum sp.]|nr:hypothetical protein [Candidatus Acidoferrum sp.]